MKLTAQQLDQYERDGFLILPNLFSPEEVEVLRTRQEALFDEDRPENVREKRSGEVRTAFGLHRRDRVFADLVRHPRLIEPALQILGDDDVYVQQVKVNVKAAFVGEVWQWHYDFATHHGDDGVPEPLALNLHVFLDDVTQFNGPLWFIPGSHRHGPVEARADEETTSYRLWVVDGPSVAGLIDEADGRIEPCIGPAGTAVIFGDLMVHCSPPNLSPWSRRIFSVIVNPVSNNQTAYARPNHIHERDFTPIETAADGCLRQHEAVVG